MEKEGNPFKGCLYFGLILTERGPMVIEYNCRFGDPEAQAILPLLKTDLLDIMEAVTDEKLKDIEINWHSSCSACIILASGGYPGSYKTGFIINGLNSEGTVPENDNYIYHAGTEFKENTFLTTGGRVLGITTIAPTLDSALESAYKTVKKIDFEGIYYRKDIGKY
jgi:phosphoribosylamine--glycine ligase